MLLLFVYNLATR